MAFVHRFADGIPMSKLHRNILSLPGLESLQQIVDAFRNILHQMVIPLWMLLSVWLHMSLQRLQPNQLDMDGATWVVVNRAFPQMQLRMQTSVHGLLEILSTLDVSYIILN